MDLRFPEPLLPGDTIGVTSPSSGVAGAAAARPSCRGPPPSARSVTREPSTASTSTARPSTRNRPGPSTSTRAASGPIRTVQASGAQSANPVVEIVRTALERKTLRHDGHHFTLPLPQGRGKPLRLNVAPTHRRVPVYLAAVGPKNLELAGEVADGWLGVFASPDYLHEQKEAIAQGRSRRDPVASGHPGHFELDVTVPVVVDADVSRACRSVAPYAALYVGGMGSREHNFYNALAVRMGYERAAGAIQDLYLDKQWRAAAEAVPEQFVDDTSLVGDVSRVRSRMQRYADAGVTTLTLAPWGESLRARMASLEGAVEAAAQIGSTG